MFEYEVCSIADNDLYKKCIDKFKNIPEFRLIKELEDVDGSLIANFDYQGSSVSIINDARTNMLYVRAEKEIESLIYTEKARQ
jgi:hypothetical protein